MRLISFRRSGRETYGVQSGDIVTDLGSIQGAPKDLKAALRDGVIASLADAAGEQVPLASVELLPVIQNPGKILCVGHNYEEHRQETGRAKTAHPSIFTRWSDTLVAHGADLVRPNESTMLDFEGELLAVIGTAGRRIPVEKALDHVAGFACANDASVRDWQWHTQQFTPGKNFPATCAVGPSLVTPDEFGALENRTIATRLNGKVMQSATFSQMIFSVAEIVSYCSTFTNLSPGDFILTGTPGGVGAKRQPPVWLSAGDVVEVEIDGLGTLTNRVVAEG